MGHTLRKDNGSIENTSSDWNPQGREEDRERLGEQLQRKLKKKERHGER